MIDEFQAWAHYPPHNTHISPCPVQHSRSTRLGPLISCGSALSQGRKSLQIYRENGLMEHTTSGMRRTAVVFMGIGIALRSLPQTVNGELSLSCLRSGSNLSCGSLLDSVICNLISVVRIDPSF
jgi:hypothetical protein